MPLPLTIIDNRNDATDIRITNGQTFLQGRIVAITRRGKTVTVMLAVAFRRVNHEWEMDLTITPYFTFATPGFVELKNGMLECHATDGRRLQFIPNGHSELTPSIDTPTVQAVETYN